MCPYPQRAQHRGSGATTDAENFVCVGDESDSNGPITKGGGSDPRPRAARAGQCVKAPTR